MREEVERAEGRGKKEQGKGTTSHRRGHDRGRGHRRDRDGPVGRDDPGVLRCECVDERFFRFFREGVRVSFRHFFF